MTLVSRTFGIVGGTALAIAALTMPSVGTAEINSPFGNAGVSTPIGGFNINTPVGSAGVNTPFGGFSLGTPMGNVDLGGGFGINTPMGNIPFGGGFNINTPVGSAGVNTPFGGFGINTPVGNIPLGGGFNINTPVGSAGVNTPFGGFGINTPVGSAGINTPFGGFNLGPVGVSTPFGGLNINTPVGNVSGNASGVFRPFYGLVNGFNLSGAQPQAMQMQQGANAAQQSGVTCAFGKETLMAASVNSCENAGGRVNPAQVSYTVQCNLGGNVVMTPTKAACSRVNGQVAQ